MNSVRLFSVLIVLVARSQFCAASDTEPESSIQYSIWISKDANVDASNYTLRVPLRTEKITFYDVMLDAAKLDSKYEFEATKHDQYGHFITAIGGVEQNAATKHYWIYGTLVQPNNEFVSAPVGVDSFYPEDGQQIVFWYKKVQFR